MNKSLVGYTGFVGGNLARQTHFSGLYNSKNISAAYGTKPGLLVFAGVRAEKFLAQNNPDEDFNLVKEAAENIKKIAPERLCLISTVDVFHNPAGPNEETLPKTQNLHPYGANRLWLEGAVTGLGIPTTILRLPALYGHGLKKNFLYDYIHRIPTLLTVEKFREVSAVCPAIVPFYTLQENGFYKCLGLNQAETAFLKEQFNIAGFTALNFTDSRASFQFYNLNFLWQHIEAATNMGLPLLHLASTPATAGEIYNCLTGKEFVNHLEKPVPHYDFKTIYAEHFGGENGYLFGKAFVLNDIQNFIETEGWLP